MGYQIKLLFVLIISLQTGYYINLFSECPLARSGLSITFKRSMSKTLCKEKV